MCIIETWKIKPMNLHWHEIFQQIWISLEISCAFVSRRLAIQAYVQLKTEKMDTFTMFHILHGVQAQTHIT